MRHKILLVILLVLVSGCATIFEKTSFQYGPDFFVCNYWIDRNQDRKVDIDEWEGVKDDFNEREHISFVGYFRQKIGTPISFKLFAPDGSLYREKFSKQTAKTTIWCQEFEAEKLVSEKGCGIWKVEWYAAGEIVNITTIRILKVPHN